jgi:hypothetical protein
MATSTKHLNLTKPDPTESAKTVTYNADLDKIEAGRTVRGIAGENITAFDAVYYDASTDRWRKALDATVGLRGIARATVASAATGYFLVMGVETNGSWAWTIGVDIFIHATTTGLLTATAPFATSRPIGVAVAATEILLYDNDHRDRLRRGLLYDIVARQLIVRTSGGAVRGFSSEQYSADGSGAFFLAQKSRSATEGAHVAVVSGDELFAFLARGSDGGAFQNGVMFQGIATETWSGSARGTRALIHLVAPGTTPLVEAWRLDPTGDEILTRATNAQKSAIASVTELTTIAAAAFTDTTIVIPAFALVTGVSVRVTVVIPTAATFDVGVAAATQRYHVALSTAADTVAASVARDGTHHYTTAVAVRITPNLTPADTTGRVRVTIHYIQLTGPTS